MPYFVCRLDVTEYVLKYEIGHLLMSQHWWAHENETATDFHIESAWKIPGKDKTKEDEEQYYESQRLSFTYDVWGTAAPLSFCGSCSYKVYCLTWLLCWSLCHLVCGDRHMQANFRPLASSTHDHGKRGIGWNMLSFDLKRWTHYFIFKVLRSGSMAW